MELTYPTNIEFCVEVSNNINKDYPGSARIETNGKASVVVITDEYWDYCQRYVRENCKINEVD